jgi:phosphoglycerate dehydrogenase-like enzyme
MVTVNVLVTTALKEVAVNQIKAVSSRIKVTDVSRLSQAAQKGDAAARKQLDALLAEAEIIYGFRLPENVIARAPKLKWFQTMSAGVDRFLDDEFNRSPVVMTSVSGIHATPIGEFVLGLMLMFAKQAPLAFQQKQQKLWKSFLAAPLRGQTVGIVGLGNIGREVARLANAFGMRVVATRRSAGKSLRARYVDRLYPREQLRQLLAESDFAVLTLPLTKETHKIIGEAELRSMKPTAYLINIARGNLIDETALVRALQEYRIAGAGLDVFSAEPLPTDSPLWEFTNVIISPHIAGGMEDYVERATEVFTENLKRYLGGRKLVNVVDKKRGY